ncbi:MAG: beta-galactosidase, partial [Clostridiales bacterium]|nr:beta-galactosidase [Clostridiales bacterium]
QETVPGIFLELTGIEVEEYDPQYQKMTKTAGVYADGTAALWCDVIKPKTAKVLGRYLEDYYKDEACFTKNTYGSGSVYYLGCDLDEEAMKRLALYLKSQSMLSTEIESRKGVEVVEVEQEAEGGKTIVVMNHNAHQVMLAASKLYYDVLNDKFIEDAVELEPYGVCILERPRD